MSNRNLFNELTSRNFANGGYASDVRNRIMDHNAAAMARDQDNRAAQAMRSFDMQTNRMRSELDAMSAEISVAVSKMGASGRTPYATSLVVPFEDRSSHVVLPGVGAYQMQLVTLNDDGKITVADGYVPLFGTEMIDAYAARALCLVDRRRNTEAELDRHIKAGPGVYMNPSPDMLRAQAQAMRNQIDAQILTRMVPPQADAKIDQLLGVKTDGVDALQYALAPVSAPQRPATPSLFQRLLAKGIKPVI